MGKRTNATAQLNGDGKCAADLCHSRAVLSAAHSAFGTIEVYHMQSLCPGAVKAKGRFQRALRHLVRGAVFPLDQADAAAAQQVDCGKKNHIPSPLQKFSRILSPVLWLFSG